MNCVDPGFCFNPMENIDGLLLQEIVYFVQIANCVLPFVATFQISVVFSEHWSCIFWPVRHAQLNLWGSGVRLILQVVQMSAECSKLLLCWYGLVQSTCGSHIRPGVLCASPRKCQLPLLEDFLACSGLTNWLSPIVPCKKYLNFNAKGLAVRATYPCAIGVYPWGWPRRKNRKRNLPVVCFSSP